jgi:hypothetical protein
MLLATTSVLNPAMPVSPTACLRARPRQRRDHCAVNAQLATTRDFELASQLYNMVKQLMQSRAPSASRRGRRESTGSADTLKRDFD